jgi:hypothetical protein
MSYSYEIDKSDDAALPMATDTSAPTSGTAESERQFHIYIDPFDGQRTMGIYPNWRKYD